jgi:hypothetical protein
LQAFVVHDLLATEKHGAPPALPIESVLSTANISKVRAPAEAASRLFTGSHLIHNDYRGFNPDVAFAGGNMRLLDWVVP